MADVIALRVAETSVAAGSAVSVYAAFRNRATAAASAPTTIRYRVDCLTTGRNVVNWTSATAAATAQFDVPGLLNAIISSDNDYEVRQLTVEADTNLDTQVRGSITWRVRNIRTYEHTAQFEPVDFTRYEPYFPITNAEQSADLVEEDLRTQYPPGDIRRYGATGNGSTDDGAAIIVADAACAAAGGGVVFFPAGTYLTSVSLKPSSRCHWVGAGREATVLMLADATNLHLVWFDSVSDASIRSMSLNGNRDNQTLDCHCLRLGNGTQERITIEDMNIFGARYYGIGAQGGTNIGIRIRNVDIWGTGADGIDFKNLDDANEDILIENVRVRDWDNRGITAQAAIDIRGPARLNHITVADPPSTAPDGVRFVVGELLDTFGFGGHRSSLTNFDIRMSGAGAGSHGVEIRGRDVTVGFGYVNGVSDGVNITSDALRARVHAVTCEDCLDDSFVVAGADSELHGCVAIGGDTALNISADRVRVFGGKAEGCDEGFIIGGSADDVELNSFNIANSVTRVGQISSGATSARIRGGTWTSNAAGLLDNGTDTILADVGGFADGYYVQGSLASVLPETGGGVKIAFADATRSNPSGATTVATNLIPAGARVLAVTTRVQTALGTSNGTTGYQVGDGSDADRWGVATTVTQGTRTGAVGIGAPTADPTGFFAAAQSVTITAVGGNFDGTGAILVVVAYTDGVPPTG